MNSSTHIIQKQQYEIQTHRQKTAMDMQQRIGEINTLHVLPLLVKKLDEYFSDQKVITIEKLEIDIGRIQKNATDRDWADLILEKLEEQLHFSEDTAHQKSESLEQSYIAESWIYFLKHGMLPADSVYRSVTELLIAIKRSEEHERMAIKHFLNVSADDNILKRLLSNADTDSLKFHFELLANSISGDDFSRLTKEIDQLVIQHQQKEPSATPHDLAVFRHSLLFNVFKILVSTEINSRTSIQYILTELESFARQKVYKQKPSKTEDGLNENRITTKNKFEKEMQAEKKDSSKNIEQHNELASLPGKEIFISNAGLCIVANWLTPFFKATGLLNDGFFIDAEKQQHAIFLLHFLATKEMQPTEELLVLPKLLCGWPLQMPAINTISFSENEIAECDDLLKSVIQHWAVLKNTSADGLRESFLQRPGKLTECEEHFLLQPEQQSIDILLEQIPWAFQFTKLPWMKKPLQTEWY